jgi:hypothetical protein
MLSVYRGPTRGSLLLYSFFPNNDHGLRGRDYYF